MDCNIALYNLICFLGISIQFDIDDYPSSKIRFHDTNILIVTKILSPLFPNKMQMHLLCYIFFRQFLVYDNTQPRAYKRGGESKPIDDAKLARIVYNRRQRMRK